MVARSGVAALIALALSCGQALAWGYQGHELVGSIADALLQDHPHARDQVAKYLGFSLRVAGPWADCVRSVHKNPDGSFVYQPAKPEYSIPCTAFEAPADEAEQARMVDYARRNWSACDYENGKAGCQDTYHFTDVAVQHGDYERAYVGTSDHDVVSAINAAIAKLKGEPVPAPFSIADEKEALFMLAHFVGDLHQPLHVGVVYLTPAGKRINPDVRKPFDPATETQGGNLILEKVEPGCTGPNLHSEWDAIPDSLGTMASAAMIAKARAVPKTSGRVEDFAAAWAGDTVREAHKAFRGLRFKPACQGHWLVRFRNRGRYASDEARLKERQLAKAGAHLAEILYTIWP